MAAKSELESYRPIVFWGLLGGALAGSLAGFFLALSFFQNIWCYLSALAGGAGGILLVARIFKMVLNLNEYQLYYGEGITGLWIRLYRLLDSWYLLVVYGLVAGFAVSLTLIALDTVNLPMQEGIARIVDAQLDQTAAYQSDTHHGRIYLVTIQLGTQRQGYHVDREAFEQTRIGDRVQVFYTESRVLHTIQVHDVRQTPSAGQPPHPF